jgi:hypothetical protein
VVGCAIWMLSSRQQHHQTRQLPPFVFRARDELVDDHLRHVHEIAELRLPDHQSVRIIEAVAIFKS